MFIQQHAIHQCGNRIERFVPKCTEDLIFEYLIHNSYEFLVKAKRKLQLCACEIQNIKLGIHPNINKNHCRCKNIHHVKQGCNCKARNYYTNKFHIIEITKTSEDMHCMHCEFGTINLLKLIRESEIGTIGDLKNAANAAS